MKHYDLPYIDKILDNDEAIQKVLVMLEDACSQCSNPDHSNRAMANLSKQTYQNLQHIVAVANDLKKKRGS